MTGKRLAIISNQAFGLRNFHGPLISDLVSRGVRVFALAPDLTDDDRAALSALGAEPIAFSLSRTGTNPIREVLDFVGLRRILGRLRLDVVLSIAIKAAIYGTLAAWVAKVPARYAMITGLGYSFGDNDTRSPKRTVIGAISRALCRIALPRSQGIFMQNHDDARDLVESGILPADRIVGVYGTGVDLSEWLPEPPVVAPMTFLLVARLLRDKGIVEYAEAARRIKSRHPSVRFVLLGGLDENPAAIDEVEVSGWVHEGLLEWPGHRPVRPWLSQASVFVLPSYREGVPRSTQEAMAMARPIITTDAPGCRDTVDEGRNGFLVPPRDIAALAAAMQRFIDEPELVARLGAQSRKLAEERFDVASINARIIAAMDLW